jgi:NDP-sugar pyrophosphorylase family protein
MIHINPLKSKLKFNTIILAAGLGKRVREVNNGLPKPMIEIQGHTAIDLLIAKFKDITDTFIVCTGYKAEILESYLDNKFPHIPFLFVRQEESELAPGPGKSAILGVAAANPTLPTIILFCDIFFEDKFSVEKDGLGLCYPKYPNKYVYDTYKTRAILSKGLITEVIINPDKSVRKNGWNGMIIFHDTISLQQICRTVPNKFIMNIDYMELISPYIAHHKVIPIYLSKMFEFGTIEAFQRCSK